MCGIAGIFNLNGAPVAAQNLSRMAEAIRHRGPDDSGGVLLCSNRTVPPRDFDDLASAPGPHNVGLVNRRLAILDLSSHGHQPMTLRELTLVYNGEVYNYLELVDELKALGHVFRSRCDTEVLLHAYDEWGAACLQRLNGIFAFAIWDGRRACLFCARDRLGVKPLYYRHNSNELLFCSEIKGLLAVLPERPGVNEALIYDFLTSGRLDHGEETFFQGIAKLPAGSYLVADRSGVQIERYWDVSATPPTDHDIATDVTRFRELFHDAIRLQMRSDVTVACCLSGGLDSSAVVSVAAPRSPYRMRTYTARFRDRRMDEWEYARSVHAIKPVEPVAVFAEPSEFWQRLPQLVWDQEEPFGGPGVFAQWNLMRQIHQDGIKVVLDGQGGDELLCGYAKYFYFSVRDMLRRGARVEAARAILDAVVKRGNHLFNFAAARRYLPGSWWLDRHSGSLIDPQFAARFPGRQTAHPRGDVRAQQELDITRFSLPVLLRYEDKNSMAHSIESRVPFLDHRLVEFAVGLPTTHKIRGSQSKYVMRQALASEMPRQVLTRRGKLGFGGYFDSWVSALSREIEVWLAQPYRPVDRFVRQAGVHHLFARRDPLLFKTIILDRWLERFGYG